MDITLPETQSQLEPIGDILDRHLSIPKSTTFQRNPLEELIDDENVEEILIHNHREIWVDRRGKLEKQKEVFSCQNSFHRWYITFCEESGAHTNISSPFANGKWKNFRAHVASDPISKDSPLISLRRHRKKVWQLKDFAEQEWCCDFFLQFLKNAIAQKKNFLVIGATSSGKTSALNALLQEVPSNERCLFLEDTEELVVPNEISTRLTTRHDPNGTLKDITLCDLVKQSLRMRPDRLIVGEVRGEEAKDLLMAMATGHKGCAGTLHAQNSQDALFRLEMLIQWGAPQWNLESIRRLIQSSIDFIIAVEKDSSGQRKLKEVCRLRSVEAFGITLEPLRPSPNPTSY